MCVWAETGPAGEGLLEGRPELRWQEKQGAEAAGAPGSLDLLPGSLISSVSVQSRGWGGGGGRHSAHAEKQEEVAERGCRGGEGEGRLIVIVTGLGTLERVENLCNLESAR